MWKRSVAWMVVGLAMATGACSDDDDSDSSVSKTCCINGSFYDCSNSEQMCTESGNTCTRQSSRDDEC